MLFLNAFVLFACLVARLHAAQPDMVAILNAVNFASQCAVKLDEADTKAMMTANADQIFQFVLAKVLELYNYLFTQTDFLLFKQFTDDQIQAYVVSRIQSQHQQQPPANNMMMPMASFNQGGMNQNQNAMVQYKAPPQEGPVPHFYSGVLDRTRKNTPAMPQIDEEALLEGTMADQVEEEIDYTEGHALAQPIRQSAATPDFPIALDEMQNNLTKGNGAEGAEAYGDVKISWTTIHVLNGRCFLPPAVRWDSSYMDYPLSRGQLCGIQKVANNARKDQFETERFLLVTEMTRRARLDLERTQRVELTDFGTDVGFKDNIKVYDQIKLAMIREKSRTNYGMDFENMEERTDEEKRTKSFSQGSDENDPWKRHLKRELIPGILTKIKSISGGGKGKDKWTAIWGANETSYIGDLLKKTMISRKAMLKASLWDCSKGRKGTDTSDLIELLITMTNEEKRAIQLHEANSFGPKLADEKDENGKKYTQGKFCASLQGENELRVLKKGFVQNTYGGIHDAGTLLIAFCKTIRSTEIYKYKLHKHQIPGYAAAFDTMLTKYTEGNVIGKVIKMLAELNYTFLRKIFDAVPDLNNKLQAFKNNKKFMKTDPDKVFAKALEAIIDDVYYGRAYYFAKLLAEKKDRLFTHKTFDTFNDFSRILVNRVAIDLLDINAEFKLRTQTMDLRELFVAACNAEKNKYSTTKKTLEAYIDIMDWVISGKNQEELSVYVNQQFLEKNHVDGMNARDMPQHQDFGDHHTSGIIQEEYDF